MMSGPALLPLNTAAPRQDEHARRPAESRGTIRPVEEPVLKPGKEIRPQMVNAARLDHLTGGVRSL
jgi:hypothetical protein